MTVASTTLRPPATLMAAATIAFAALAAIATPARAVETDMAISTTSVDFGDVNVGNTATVSVTLTNTGSDPFGPINMFGGAPPTAEFNASQSCQGATLAAGGSCTVTYSFTPSAPGAFSDVSAFTISETASQADGEDFSVTLAGTGVNPVTAAPLALDFGAVLVGVTSSPMVVVITNTSGDPFGPINMFGGAPPTAEFNASQNCQGSTLAAGGTCQISYTFTPSAAGLFSDSSTFTISATADQSAGENFSVTLSGCGATEASPCASSSASASASASPSASAPESSAASVTASASASLVAGASGGTGAGTPAPAASMLPDTADVGLAVGQDPMAVVLAGLLMISIAVLAIAARRTAKRAG